MPVTDKKLSFVVAAPPYTPRSGGVMVLHELCTELNQVGYKTGLALITEGSQVEQKFKFATSSDPSFLQPDGNYYDYFSNRTNVEIEEFLHKSIAIYPDIVKGNPLGCQHFCTYVLGVPKFDIETQFLISFSKLYIDRSDFTLHKTFIHPSMNASGSKHWPERTLNLTYIGKGSEFLDCYRIPGTVLLERDWPRDKEQLALLLRNCRYFFTWDCVSATNTDAILCGAVPVLMHDKQIPRAMLNSGELGPYPNIEYSPELLHHHSLTNQPEVDRDLERFRNRMFSYSNNWHVAVATFAAEVGRRFARS
jgi:hypothetical protein